MSPRTSTVVEPLAVLRGAQLASEVAAEDQPFLVIGIDDVQWLGPESAQAVSYALPRWTSTPVGLVVTWRAGSTEQVGSNALPGPMEVVEVGPLDDVTLTRLVAHRAGSNSQDRTWMVAAHQSTLAEIAAGTAAQQQAHSQNVRDLGAMFVQMHTTLDANLKSAAGTLGVALPSAPTPAQQQSLAAVKAKTGTAFDTAWVAQQIAGHRNTLAATQTELSSVSDATVLALAKASTLVVQSHLTALLKLSGTTPSVIPAGSGGQAALLTTFSTQPSDQPVTAVALLAAAGAALLLASAGWKGHQSRARR